jgi:hypothetical protein
VKLLRGLLLFTVLSFSALAPVTAAPLPFDIYVRLYVGMHEADLLTLAGKPDYIADGGAADLPDKTRTQAGSASVRQYEWRADGVVPYTTVVSVSGGMVVAIRRESDF